MPQGICSRCCRQLQATQAFIERAQAVNEKLWYLLDNLQAKTQDYNDYMEINCLEEMPIEIFPTNDDPTYSISEIGNEDKRDKQENKEHEDEKNAIKDRLRQLIITNDDSKHSNCLQETPIDLPICNEDDFIHIKSEAEFLKKIKTGLENTEDFNETLEQFSCTLEHPKLAMKIENKTAKER